jgi:hypothetical protein
MNVSRKIHSHTVVARPVFRGGPLPSFWEAEVDNRTIPRKFSSPHEVFEFVEQSGRRVRGS